MSCVDLLRQRDKALDEILDNFKSWNGDAEDGFQLIKANAKAIDKIEALNLQLLEFPQGQDEEYKIKILEIMEKQKKLQILIKEEQKHLLENMQQLHKSKKIINNYISKKKSSLFIDKDIK